jgi:N-acetylglucosaminyldiphosphoundecaprenol N-acetyl-beta-D-mannosaminyltransferase
LLVALGCPKQEIWMHRHREALRPAVMLGVGATLEFLAGRIPRAPRWMAKAGLEWFFRLSREPRRLARRYLVHDTRFLPILLATWREPRSRRVA